MDEKIKIELANDTSSIKQELIIKLKNQIQSINGNEDPSYIENAIRKMPIVDSKALREYIQKVEPSFNEDIEFECASCQSKFTEKFIIDDKFLELPPNYRTIVMEECFLCYYYGKGVSRNETYDMTVLERKWTVNRINEEIEKKNKAEEDAMRKAKSKRS